ncbi:helix-turn-helix transcriptional regulator [Herbiconiux ginsengi]|uniref:Addiction module antidote protein, HigA family n=1 Tax=Herbiconiux ginsengi TaxID=381665 RepID=A0A1H3QRT6_9MICO|nr:hypothetical protein [Herbiconiux ginsengi]SDZ16302.1 addiction module antidote protein, HigA family [Herbiconiux ginsengi]
MSLGADPESSVDVEQWAATAEKPLDISPYRFAQAIDVPARRIDETVQGKRGIRPTAAQLARAFGTSDCFWTNYRTRYDLELVIQHSW